MRKVTVHEINDAVAAAVARRQPDDYVTPSEVTIEYGPEVAFSPMQPPVGTRWHFREGYRFEPTELRVSVTGWRAEDSSVVGADVELQ